MLANYSYILRSQTHDVSYFASFETGNMAEENPNPTV